MAPGAYGPDIFAPPGRPGHTRRGLLRLRKRTSRLPSKKNARLRRLKRAPRAILTDKCTEFRFCRVERHLQPSRTLGFNLLSIWYTKHNPISMPLSVRIAHRHGRRAPFPALQPINPAGFEEAWPPNPIHPNCVQSIRRHFSTVDGIAAARPLARAAAGCIYTDVGTISYENEHTQSHLVIYKR